MCSLPFWGDVGIKKWSPFFCYGIRSAVFWHVKTGTFSKSARFHAPKNGTSDAETKKRRPLFHANIPPKRWTRYLFCAFTHNKHILKNWTPYNAVYTTRKHGISVVLTYIWDHVDKKRDVHIITDVYASLHCISK